jgi:xanthine dehydrogenase accessory factor
LQHKQSCAAPLHRFAIALRGYLLLFGHFLPFHCNPYFEFTLVLAFWKTLALKLEQGQRVYLAFVAANAAHSPGTAGAKLLVSEDGETHGTVGGGIMEFNIVERAKKELKRSTFAAEIQTLHHRKSGRGEKSGMICSGSQSNLYYLCRPDKELQAVKKAAGLIEKDRAGVLSISKRRMAVRENELDLKAPQICLLPAEATNWLYEEQLLNFKRIAIIGGGHCALALSRVMKQLSYEVFVFETRENVKTLRENTFARQTAIVDDFRQVGRMIRYPELSDVIIMTMNYPSDVRGLLGVVKYPFPFIGLMGSRAKITRIFKDLRQAGVTKTDLQRLFAPVGLPINSHTPEEIAISVAAQVLQERGKFRADEAPTT